MSTRIMVLRNVTGFSQLVEIATYADADVMRWVQTFLPGEGWCPVMVGNAEWARQGDVRSLAAFLGVGTNWDGYVPNAEQLREAAALPAQLLRDTVDVVLRSSHPNKEGVAKHFMDIVREKAFGKPHGA